MRNTSGTSSEPDTPTSLERAVRRQHNLQVVGTFAGLLALVGLLNLTPAPLWICEQFGLDRDVPASLLGKAYWDDCFGGPLGDFAAGPLPRPEHLSYAPEADQFLAELEKLAAQEEAIEAAEAKQAEAEQTKPESQPASSE